MIQATFTSLNSSYEGLSFTRNNEANTLLSYTEVYTNEQNTIAVHLARTTNAGAETLRSTIITNGESYTFNNLALSTEDDNLFIGAEAVQVPIYDTSSYLDYDASITEMGDIVSSEPGLFSPMVIRPLGPDTLLSKMEAITIEGQDYPVVLMAGSYYVGRDDMDETVATVTFSNMKTRAQDDIDESLLSSIYAHDDDLEFIGAPQPGEDGVELEALQHGDEVMDNAIPEFDQLAESILMSGLNNYKTGFTDQFKPQYYKGLAEGFLGNGKGVVSGLWGLTKGVVKFGVKYSGPGILYKFTFGDRFRGEMQTTMNFVNRSVKFLETAKSYWPVVRDEPLCKCK